MITRGTLTYAVDETVSLMAFEEIMQDMSVLFALYEVRAASGRRTVGAQIGSLGELTTKTEGAQADEDSITQQWKKDYTFVAKGKRVPLSREIIEDNEWGVLEELGMQLGMAVNHTMETDGAALFNDAFGGGSYASGDGSAICGTHTNADGGNSQSNRGTSALSYANLVTVRQNMRGFTNSRSLRIRVNPDELLVPVELENDAFEIVKSMTRPDNANSVANMFSSGMTMYVWEALTDATNWFVMDSRMRRQNLRWWQRVDPEFYGDGNLHAGTRTIGTYTRYINGALDWRWIYGQEVAG